MAVYIDVSRSKVSHALAHYMSIYPGKIAAYDGWGDNIHIPCDAYNKELELEGFHEALNALYFHTKKAAEAYQKFVEAFGYDYGATLGKGFWIKTEAAGWVNLKNAQNLTLFWLGVSITAKAKGGASHGQ